MKYRKKPVVIEAVQFVDSDPEKLIQAFNESPQWLREAMVGGIIRSKLYLTSPLRGFFEIKTLEGVMRLNEGDWLIRGIKGELYPCKDEIFKMTYEKVEDEDNIV